MDVERPRMRVPAAEIEEVVPRGGRGASSAGTPPRPPRRPRGPGPAARAALVVGGLAGAIVLAGLLGPRPQPAVEEASGRPSARPAPASLRPDGAPSPPEAAIPVPTAPVPLFRRAGPPLRDQHALVAGRWMHLATGRPVAGAPEGCAHRRILVLGGGRIVCVTAEVTRAPGSRLAIFDLAVVTMGLARTDPAEPPPEVAPGAGPQAEAEPQALATLLGRRDVVIGDPVAIAVAPGPGRDELVLAWAAAGDGDYEIGLEAFRLAHTGSEALRLGDWSVGRAAGTGRDAIDTLADLAVTAEAAGRALVGWTESGSGGAEPVRRLVAVRLDGSAPPVALPAAATRNLRSETAGGRLRPGTPCGGGFGEGLAGDGTAWVVCPGVPATLRVLDLGAGGGGRTARHPDLVLAEASLDAAGTTVGTAWLAGNGVVADPSAAVLYRWSPAAGTIWRVELGAGEGAAPRVASVGLLPRRGALETGVTGDARGSVAPRPNLALDAVRGRLYALDAPVPRTAGRAVVHVIDTERLRYLWSFPLADAGSRAIALSPDGRLLYASTQPRQVGSPPDAVGLAVLDAATGVELAYAGRLRVGSGGPLEAVVVR